MKYFFVLGTNTALSVAELAAILDLKNAELLAPDFLVWETNDEISPVALMRRLGGTIKIGEIRAVATASELTATITKLADAKQKKSPEHKFNFGLSSYGPKRFNEQDLGLKLKKHFSDQKISARYVISQEKTLSSVVVTQNKLASRGLEIILCASGAKGGQVLVGETLIVQPFKDLSRRDYGRPARDDQSGMLPPKLAQVMINLAQPPSAEAVIVDPFCGSGTILSEAVLMGYKKLFASDIALKAIEDTRQNLDWLKGKYSLEDFRVKLQVKNVIHLSKFIKAGYAEAIITEPFLGPQRGLIAFKNVIDNLENLYSLALSEFHKILAPDGRVVMIWPSFYGRKPITPDLNGWHILEMVPEKFRTSLFVKQSERGTIIYGRPGQKVYREVVVLEKG